MRRQSLRPRSCLPRNAYRSSDSDSDDDPGGSSADDGSSAGDASAWDGSSSASGSEGAAQRSASTPREAPRAAAPAPAPAPRAHSPPNWGACRQRVVVTGYTSAAGGAAHVAANGGPQGATRPAPRIAWQPPASAPASTVFSFPMQRSLSLVRAPRALGPLAGLRRLLLLHATASCECVTAGFCCGGAERRCKCTGELSLCSPAAR